MELSPGLKKRFRVCQWDMNFQPVASKTLLHWLKLFLFLTSFGSQRFSAPWAAPARVKFGDLGL